MHYEKAIFLYLVERRLLDPDVLLMWSVCVGLLEPLTSCVFAASFT